MKLRWVYLSVWIVLGTGCARNVPKTGSDITRLNIFQFEQVDSLLTEEVRPLAIFLHAPWCTFCRNMEQTTFKDNRVINRLNEKYYFISFDGEQKEAVIYRGKEFKFIPSGRNQGTHELAMELGGQDGVVTYPTFLILDEAEGIVFRYSAFVSKKAMITVLDEGSL